MLVRPSPRAFTLPELLLSAAILLVIVILCSNAVFHTSALVRRTTGKVEQFQSARSAFERMAWRLSQASLNTFYDYDDVDSPRGYTRQSELRFLCGSADNVLPQNDAARVSHCVFFFAPLGFSDVPEGRGLENLLNTCGYYVEFGSDRADRPAFLTSLVPERYRFRLKEFVPPARQLAIYQYTSGKDPGSGKLRNESYNGIEWIRDGFGTNGPEAGARTLADNVIALILVPRLPRAEEISVDGGNDADFSPLAPRYAYNSRSAAPQSSDDPAQPEQTSGSAPANRSLNPFNQLPPLMQATLIAIDEVSAQKIGLDKDDADFFELSKRFRDTRRLTKDLSSIDPDDDSLVNLLNSKRIHYRTFTTTVPLRAAKWSRESPQ